MNLLILGGTSFLGPELIEAALAAGATITTFNRGRTDPELATRRGWKIEELRGDRDPKRDEGVTALEQAVRAGRTWDAVIDTSGYVPRIVEASANLLKDAARQYIFVSTISVYVDNSKGPDEDSTLGTLEDPSVEGVTGATYGPLKALCEEAARRVFEERATIVRPGLIVGPGDPTDRFTYWPVRLDRGGSVLLPVAADPWASRVQWIDVRDLAEWILRLARDGHGGTFNALGPRGGMSFQEFVFGCRAATASEVDFVPIPEAFVAEQGVGMWMELPLWIPQSPETAGFGRASNERALAVGLTFRPLAVTAADVIDWFRRTRPAEFDFGMPDDRGRTNGGLSRGKEERVITAWRKNMQAGE